MKAAELKRIRLECELSQEQLGASLGVTEKTVRRWEAGDFPIPPDKALLAKEQRDRHELELAGFLYAAFDEQRALHDGNYIAYHSDCASLRHVDLDGQFDLVKVARLLVGRRK